MGTIGILGAPARALLGAALLLGTLHPARAVPPTAPRRGIIQFHTAVPDPETLPGLRLPSVIGGELITWWGDIEKREGVFDWSAIDHDLAAWRRHGKTLDIRLSTVHLSPDTTPRWLYDRYAVRRIGRGAFADFEAGPGPYELLPGAALSGDPAHHIAGRRSVACQAGPAGAQILRLGPTRPLLPGATYSVQWDERARPGSTVTLVLEPVGGGPAPPSWSFAAARGTVTRSVTLTVGPEGGRRLAWYAGPRASVAIDNVNVIRLEESPEIHSETFESAPPHWQLMPGAEITDAPGEVISGARSLALNGGEGGFRPLIVNEPYRFPIVQGSGYRFALAYRAITDCTLRYRLVAASDPSVVLDQRVMPLKAGAAAAEAFYYPAFVWRPDAVVQFGLDGPGRIVIDDLSWMAWSDRVACFPDYFSPVFRAKWAAFVAAFAQRYGRAPGIGTVSVGGFGRWEEVMLDDDMPGILDDQWLSRGFTPERYLRHITDCMDLYKRLLPTRPLRICLAYGLRSRNDVSWVYRRVAQAAVARGIGLKQNGMTERYDTWDAGTDTSYLYNRYRDRSDISLTYETAGQIYRNSSDVTGHPVSLLNRAVIDGTGVLFLYGGDLAEPNVTAHLPAAAAMLRGGWPARFYCRLGDYSMVNHHSPVPVIYHNLWLGLRQVQLPGAQAIYTEIDGVRCAATSTGNRNLAFDLDDRAQYNGMYNVVIGVEYLDRGTDSFAVGVHNSRTGRWQPLTTIRKTGDGRWKRVTLRASEWCDSPRNRGEDVHVDLAIDDLADGPEHVRLVDLRFLPARSRARTLLLPAPPPTARRRPLAPAPISRTIANPAGRPLVAVAIPIWTGGALAPNGVSARVWDVRPAGERLLVSRDYDMPADGDWFELPLPPGPVPRALRLELCRTRGVAGWRLDAAGRPAIRLWAAPRTARRPP